MRATSSHLLLCLFLLLGLGLLPTARADVTVAAKQIDLPGLRLQDVNAQLGEDPAGGLHLQLQASQADVAAMGWRHVGLHLEGRLQRDAQLRWVFDGRVQLRGAPGGALADAQLTWVLDPDADTMQVEVQQDKALANAWLPLDQPSHAKISLHQLPAGWLQGVLGRLWPARLTSGHVDADLALDVEDASVQSSGQFTLDDVGFDTPSNAMAGQGVAGSGRFGFDNSADGRRVNVQCNLEGGELLLGPFYAKLPAHPVQLDVDVRTRQGTVELQKLYIDDMDALQLDGAMAFDARGKLQKLQLNRFQANFPLASQRYGQAWLATLGLRDARIAGRVAGSIDWRSDGLHAFAFDTDGLDLADGEGRFAVSGLHGGLDWSAQDDRPATTLAWQGLQLRRISVAAATSHWRDRGGSLILSQPLAMPMLKGEVRLTSLDWRPAPARGQRITASVAVAGVDMADLSRMLDWPIIPGTLAGTFPSLRWANDRLELDGSLAAGVFGGTVEATHLSLQQPFGDAPVLAGDFKFDQLDLAAFTSVFDIGAITGRLHGAVDDLRLVDWHPVAFKASLLADGGGRISQRAVNNLAALSGGGVANGLQGAMLKLFRNFSYKRIGLACTLQSGVCLMGGLANEEDGYTIIDGSGLPHLQLLGRQTKVDWPTLQRRLHEAASSRAPTAH
ncbi:hypothetical protein IHE49_10510 [Rhodanobacter sp. 7MK24]|uniref:hypothetical protein n=1 Tax=Rhodanobacter sp. 7MK24 TaxID=2775922 RepID=UPI001782F27B|nr:hypothetical protein [Rhodanobacter sp. 7MK24]MBD8880920.1 hypothetical protein [Rhodanobacter sp. 7MK24]